MIQNNLLGKKAINYEKCPECEKNKPEHEIYDIEIYHPFNSEPSFSGQMCESCYDEYRQNIALCELCSREIYHNNGYRVNIRWNEQTEEYECVSCLQKHWFENGMEKFDDADWFNDSDLVKHGFNKLSSYFCRTDDDYKYTKQAFDIHKERGNKPIVVIERSGMGLEYYIAIWIKENKKVVE